MEEKIVARQPKDRKISGVREKQKRMTKQKMLIWQILSQTKCHPTAEWVYVEARKDMPNISLGTVYRNLQLLVADGMAQELNYGKGVSRFDANAGTHYHFVCEKCGKVCDVEMPLAKNMMLPMADCSCGKVHRYRLEFYGLCNDCMDER